MKKIAVLVAFAFVFTSLFFAAGKFADYEKYWHQWRGPYMTGVSPNGNPPLEWSETKNLKWKISIPGKGHASPVIWGDQIFILTAIETDKDTQEVEESEPPQQAHRGMPVNRTTKVHKFVIFAINRHEGKILWQRTVKEEAPQEGTHEMGSWASHSPVTDGEHVYAYFGSRGLFCFDMQGTLIWERDFGQLNKRMNFGEGSSPALYEDRIIVNWDHEGQSFIIALDKKTGKDIWKVDRDEGTSWATPLVVENDGKLQVVTSATKLVRSYDFNTGRLLWECSGMTQNAIPSPLAADGMLYVMSGFRGNALLAIDLSKAKGDIVNSDAIVWQHDKDTPYAPSGMLFDNKLYFFRSNNGILSCFDARTGKEYYSGQRLEGMGN
ncbi:MAG: PQQ-binding-like beta-propeller repeat protein, partial [candidate division Zixibacteria bacterium]|nr:PQQ-binding-like beta-propeller repeat protein [candidate division Zixibacteria bacterium]